MESSVRKAIEVWPREPDKIEKIKLDEAKDFYFSKGRLDMEARDTFRARHGDEETSRHFFNGIEFTESCKRGEVPGGKWEDLILVAKGEVGDEIDIWVYRDDIEK